MTLSAHDVAAVLRDRLPGVPTKKLHKLLYYCQGHHLAGFGVPLFREGVSAYDMGPVVGALWYAEKQGGPVSDHGALDEAQLNTVGYVLSRYGALTGKDLENLTHSESPWQRADRGRRPGDSARIEQQWIQEYFEADGGGGGGGGDRDEVVVDSGAVTRWLQGANERRNDPLRPDRPEDIATRLDEVRARLAPRA